MVPNRERTFPISSQALRIRFLLLTVLLFFTELFIGAFVHDRFIRPYVGDMLVVILIYSTLRILIPRGVRPLIWCVFFFAAAVEVLQYFNLPRLLGVEQFGLARIILGSTFDIKDIGCYLAGCLAVWAAEVYCRRRSG